MEFKREEYLNKLFFIYLVKIQIIKYNMTNKETL